MSEACFYTDTEYNGDKQCLKRGSYNNVTYDDKYRFNWNAPIIWSKHEPNTYYHGAQVLLRTTDMGKTWTEASPDLTRNDKAKQGKPGGPYTNEAVGAENYGTLSYVIESPNEKGVIYTGSDDGFVQLTKDGGKTWKNVTPAGLAECRLACRWPRW